MTGLKYGSVYVYNVLSKQGSESEYARRGAGSAVSEVLEVQATSIPSSHHLLFYLSTLLLPLLVFKQDDGRADRRYTAAVCSQVYYFTMPTGLLSIFPIRPAQQRRKYTLVPVLSPLRTLLWTS